MTYEGPVFYDEEDFIGFTKHDVLDGEVEALMHNMEAAGLDPNRVLHAVEEAVKESYKKEQ